MKKENKSSRSKYTIFTLIVCIIAALSGKPVSEIFTSDTTAVQETTAYEETYDYEETRDYEEVDSDELPDDTEIVKDEEKISDYSFRSQKLLDDHFEKHGLEMGFETPEAYVEGANRVISSPDALHKLEAEDNDDIYYLEKTNEFVVVSQDGYIRTYFQPSAGIDYFNRQ